MDRAQAVREAGPVEASGIVLAGGRGRRFGGDKLVADLGGTTVLEHAIERVAGVCSEVLVIAGPAASDWPTASWPPHVRIVREPEPFGGPLAATLAGLESVRLPVALVAGGDMPALVPAVLGLLLARLVTREANAAILGSPGRPQTLPLAVQRDPAIAAARELFGRDERSLQGLVTALGALIVDETAWRALDPEGETLRDIDRPSDLLDPGVS